MSDDNVWQEEEELMDEEACRLADEFLDLAQAGRNPDPEEFLFRHPAYEKILRPVVEGAAMLVAEMRRNGLSPGASQD